jgi:hypothetical protein
VESARAFVKAALTRIGERLTARALYALNACLNYLYVGWWMRERGYTPCRRLSHHRDDVFDELGARVANERVLYLEFGVASGESICRWSRLLLNPESKLHGFDSFEGLPADWTIGKEASHFSTGGRVPQVEDTRVRFHKGWFDETLPAYEWPDHDRLVVVLDADLYSSTLTVLDQIEDRIVPGTFLYFDEFNHRADELRAFDEFTRRTGMRFRVAVASSDLAHVAFERVG